MTQLGRIQDEGAVRAVHSQRAAEGASMGAKLYQVIADTIIKRDYAEAEQKWKALKTETDADLAQVSQDARTPEEKALCAAALKNYQALVSHYEGLQGRDRERDQDPG
jgi:hypothetical protein